MSKRIIVILGFIMIFASGGHVYAHILSKPPGPIKHEFSEPHEVIALFYTAVRNGELTLFGKNIDQSMLIPLQVEYVYELNDPVPRIKVYSVLKKPIPLPGQDKCSVHGVGVTLDDDGHIIEIKAHVWPDE